MLPGLSTGDWSKSGGGLQEEGRKDFLKLRDESPSPPVLTLLRQLVARECSGSSTPFAPAGTDLPQSPLGAQTKEQTLQRLALLVAASTPNVDVVLCGARRGKYAADLAEVSSWDALEAETCWGIFDAVQDAVEELAENQN